jgi:hypothetical protein
VPLPDRGNSSPIVWHNRIFITQAIEKENRLTVMCLNRADGRILWQSGITRPEKDPTHETNPYGSASPVTDGERVIAWFGWPAFTVTSMAKNLAPLGQKITSGATQRLL